MGDIPTRAENESEASGNTTPILTDKPGKVDKSVVRESGGSDPTSSDIPGKVDKRI